ncbi:MAG: protein kinase [Polyangiaceae bacterium]
MKLRPWRLHGYQPIGRIANGGMAEVWLARHLGAGGFERLVAVKRLHAHHSTQQDFVEMFLHEARLAAFIHHPNVVSIHATCAIERDYYLVMDYVEGPTLSRLRRKARLTGTSVSLPIVARLMLDTLSGLHAAHDACDHFGEPLHLIHRDCTPQNILVGVDGSARLTDFGVARAKARLESSKDGTLKGKLSYLAPEQATDTQLDRRVDVFSAGAMLWELVAGQRLFQGESEASTLAKVLKMPIPSLRTHRSGVPAELDTICRRALARNPENRFASAIQMYESIEQYARAHGGIATRREVATFIEGLVGRELARRRFHVRNWIRATPTRDAGPVGHPAADPTFSLPPPARAMSQIPPPSRGLSQLPLATPAALNSPPTPRSPVDPSSTATPALPPSTGTLAAHAALERAADANLFGRQIKTKSRPPKQRP